MLKGIERADQELFDAANGFEDIPVTSLGLAIEVAHYRADGFISAALSHSEEKWSSGQNLANRNRFIRRPEFRGWMALSRYELNTGVNGLNRSIGRAAKTKKGNPTRAVMSTYESAVDYVDSSCLAIGLLQEALEDSADTGAVPDPDSIRNNKAVLAELASYLEARNSLDKYKWRPKASMDHAKRLVVWRKYLKNASDSMLQEVWSQDLNSQVGRMKFWQTQLVNADHHRAVMEIKRNPTLDLRWPKYRRYRNPGHQAEAA